MVVPEGAERKGEIEYLKKYSQKFLKLDEKNSF